ncbi:hypothetical protein VPH35_076669 [Triticum aestivum]
MVAVCAVILMKASSCNYCRPTRAAPGETLGSGFPDRMMAALRCRFSVGSIVCEVALEVRGRRWSGFVLHGASVEMSSHAWPTGATLCHAWSAGATHDRSSRDFKLCRLVVLGGMVLRDTGGDRDVLSSSRAGRWCRWATWWRRWQLDRAGMMRQYSSEDGVVVVGGGDL